ncbi:hypothetical protein GLOIN_2v1719369 [Rhizophagus clarus]|uniref:Uncharacterized protein n=1 Tax=Rhizophagus clarus TaxID=94130 RepID=A0A8H3L6L2_9GLOM|nr:hypothetical protein GLOIN_2v1719369 [Rhizophagus clarus]
MSQKNRKLKQLKLINRRKVLLEPAAILSKKPASKWNDQDVKPLAEILAGRIAIDGTGENKQGMNALGKIEITTCRGTPPANVKNYPTVADSEAQHFIGWLQGTNPGIRAFLVHAAHAAVLY